MLTQGYLDQPYCVTMAPKTSPDPVKRLKRPDQKRPDPENEDQTNATGSQAKRKRKPGRCVFLYKNDDISLENHDFAPGLCTITGSTGGDLHLK